METALIVAGLVLLALAVRYGVKKYLARKRIDDRLEQVRGLDVSPEEMANWAELMRGVEEAHAERAEVAMKERKVA